MLKAFKMQILNGKLYFLSQGFVKEEVFKKGRKPIANEWLKEGFLALVHDSWKYLYFKLSEDEKTLSVFFADKEKEYGPVPTEEKMMKQPCNQFTYREGNLCLLFRR